MKLMFNSLSHKLRIKNMDYMELRENQQKKLVENFADEQETFNCFQKGHFEFKYSINKYYGNRKASEIFFNHIFGLVFHVCLHVSCLLNIKLPFLIFLGVLYAYSIIGYLIRLELGRVLLFLFQGALLVS